MRDSVSWLRTGNRDVIIVVIAVLVVDPVSPHSRLADHPAQAAPVTLARPLPKRSKAENPILVLFLLLV